MNKDSSKLLEASNWYESDGAWATPEDTWTDDVRHHLSDEERNDPNNKPKNEEQNELEAPLFGQKGGCRVAKATF